MSFICIAAKMLEGMYSLGTVRMVHYDLTHLRQGPRQAVQGPIQDDEALFLFSIIRGMRLKTIFEIGGLGGYSARNFLKAIDGDGVVFTCDVNPVPKLARNHICIQKNALHLLPQDLENRVIDLIFFDCHDYDVQMSVFNRLTEFQIINDNTVLALHDTNTHPFKSSNRAYSTSQGFVHQKVERMMVNDFADKGYHAFCLHTRPSAHSADFPFRHGLTVMQKFKPLEV